MQTLQLNLRAANVQRQEGLLRCEEDESIDQAATTWRHYEYE